MRMDFRNIFHTGFAGQQQVFAAREATLERRLDSKGHIIAIENISQGIGFFLQILRCQVLIMTPFVWVQDFQTQPCNLCL